MNTLFHFLINYILIQLGFGNADSFLVPIFLSSVILDLDHLPYILSRKGQLMHDGLGEKSRSFMHELVGLFIVTAFYIIAYFTADRMLSTIVYTCLLMHYTVDFLSGRTRPFYPFSKKVLVSPFAPGIRKNKVAIEIILTIAAGVVFWLSLKS